VIFYFGELYQNKANSPHFLATFFHGWGFALFETKMCSATFWAIFTNLSGHPGLRPRKWILCRSMQGCQMVCFQTKNPNYGKIWRALEYKMSLYFMTFWNILQAFGIICSLLV
jgi:hypothetical protein